MNIEYYEEKIKENPYKIDNYIEISKIYYKQNNYNKVIEYLEVALNLTKDNYLIYEMLSFSYFYKKELYKSFFMAYNAYQLNKTNRLKINLETIKKAINNITLNTI